MATIKAEDVDWLGGSSQPESATGFLAISSIVPAQAVRMNQLIIPAPDASTLAPENAIGYATAG